MHMRRKEESDFEQKQAPLTTKPSPVVSTIFITFLSEAESRYLEEWPKQLKNNNRKKTFQHSYLCVYFQYSVAPREKQL